MKKIAFRMNGIFGEIFYELESEYDSLAKKQLAVYLSGLPGSTGKNAGTEFVASKNYAVVHLQYYGTFDSDGEFSPESAVQTIKDFNKIILGGKIIDVKNQKEIAIRKQINLLIGHSFGCYVAIKSYKHITNLERALFFSPLIGFGSGYGSTEDPISQISYIKRGRPYTYRFRNPNKWVRHFEQDIKNTTRENRFINDKNISFMLVVGNSDSGFDIGRLSQIVQEDRISLRSGSLELLVVENGRHSIDSLLNEKTTTQLSRFIS